MAGRRALLSPFLLGAVMVVVAAMPADRKPSVTAEPRSVPALVEPLPEHSTRLSRVALPPPAEAGVPIPQVRAVADPQAMPDGAVGPSPVDGDRGRLLLDRIEKGEGPSIEIAWPDDPASRRRLLQHLERCAGWTVLLLSGGKLWRAGDPPGLSWTPNPEQVPSGLLRDVEGMATDGAMIAAIRTRHGLSAGIPVASVERAWDAKLLGGLDRLLDSSWTGGAVRARYAIGADRLTIADITLNGSAVAGTVDLGAVSRCGR
ncbi:hypothetical protein [Thalassobaculum sp.]|uniref:hypothetical protein n=1 Tax=Thalassobaculum sp. TaxID=2022740 RepID=UPI0032ECC643